MPSAFGSRPFLIRSVHLSLADTYRCVLNGQHPYLLPSGPDGSDQSLTMNEGYHWKEKLFSEQGRAPLEKLSLAPWASRRRQELLELLDRMNPTIEELTAAVEREARKRPAAQRLMWSLSRKPTDCLRRDYATNIAMCSFLYRDIIF
jgi:hypothetical protein